MGFKTTIAAVALTALAGTAHAGTISISSFSAGSYGTELAASGNVVTEDFEGATVGNVDNGFSTG